MGNQLTVQDKLDVATGYSIDYEWTPFNYANGDYQPHFAFSSTGNMYAVSEMFSCSLYSVDKLSGNFTFLFRLTNADTSDRFAQPWRIYAVAMDTNDNIYCLDGNSYNQADGWADAHTAGYLDGRFIYKIDMSDPINPSGSWFTPGSAPGTSELANLMPKNMYTNKDLTIDKNGNIYFIARGGGDNQNYPPGPIIKISPDGETFEIFAGDRTSKALVDGIGENAQLHTPNTLDIDSWGNMYMIDVGNYPVDANGSALRVISTIPDANTSLQHVTRMRSDKLTTYEQNNAEITNEEPVIVGETTYPIIDVTPNVSIKNTDNTSTGAILKLSNSRGANAGVNNDVAGEIRFLNNDSVNNNQSFGNIKVTASDVTATSETGKLELGVACSTKGDVKSALTIEGGVEEKNIDLRYPTGFAVQ